MRSEVDVLTGQLAFTNPKVQRLRRLLGRRSSRSEDGAFVVEGAVLIGEAIAAGWDVEAEFVAPGHDPVSTARWFELADGVLERVATTEHPRPHLAVIRVPMPLTLADLSVNATGGPGRDAAGRSSFVVVVDQLNDPGNLGTIMRSAEAAGVDAVVVTPGSVDPFNPKVVRASAGSLFHVPIVAATVAEVRAAGWRVVATSSHQGDRHTEADWSGAVALVVGNEAHGLPADAAVDCWVRIEQSGRAESLNVAMATTVLVFTAVEARRP